MNSVSSTFQPIPRLAEAAVRSRMAAFPVLTITGPRQSGKTTLARLVAASLPYFSLEDPDLRAFADQDPRAFLAQCVEGAVIDEIQRVPSLFSYLQNMVDADRRMGRFILTGSSQFELIQSITQSLAGRAAMVTLLPFTMGELVDGASDRAPKTVDDLLYSGLFPPIYDRGVEPAVWLQEYVGTYLERDVRQILKIQDLATFQRFVQLCAGRVGQLLNVSSLAADAGVSRVTAESWLSVLQASNVIFLVRPWFANTSKRLVKAPKIYFHDHAIAAWLLGIRSPAHVLVNPQRGSLFENWVMTELLKSQTNAGQKPSLYFLRDKAGHEIDAIVETAPDTFQAIEVKSGLTVPSDAFDGLDFWRRQLDGKKLVPWLIHGGLAYQQREKATVLPWNNLQPLTSRIANQ